MSYPVKDVSNYLSLFKKPNKIIFDLGNLVDDTVRTCLLISARLEPAPSFAIQTVPLVRTKALTAPVHGSVEYYVDRYLLY